MKLSKLIATSSLPESLIRATVKQAGGWESFKEMASDVTNHGADSGFSGFTYYTDTVNFTERNQAEILQACGDMASDLGESSRYAMIAGFQCLKMQPDEVAEAIYNKRIEERTNVFNALAWFALEEVSRAYCDAVEMEA